MQQNKSVKPTFDYLFVWGFTPISTYVGSRPLNRISWITDQYLSISPVNERLRIPHDFYLVSGDNNAIYSSLSSLFLTVPELWYV